MDPNSRLAALGAAGAAGEGLYVEDVFSTYLYTGTGSTQTITNGIDLAGEGGMVWVKNRSESAREHVLTDTERGANELIYSSATNAEATGTWGVNAFNSDGFSLTGGDSYNNSSSSDYASWTFRKAPGFFDVVTYTGTGANRTIAHNLGSVPGCIIVKRTDTTGDWQVYHRSNTAAPETDYLVLNSTATTADSNTRWNDTAPTSSEFTVGTEATVNASGGTYVAYVFAHDAGGFGDDGTESVIKCGSYSSTGFVDLGFEPQWVMIKSTDNTSAYTGDWRIFDNMRGIVDGDDAQLFANETRAEDTGSFASAISLNATGFTVEGQGNYGTSTIYIAIRRGPMKTPEDATEVFEPDHTREDYSTSGFGKSFYAGFPVDLALNPRGLDGTSHNRLAYTRFTGDSALRTNTSDAESTSSNNLYWDSNVGWYESGAASTNDIAYMFRRAPGFFDVVTYTGNNSTQLVSHNLEAIPELIIIKSRTSTAEWLVYESSIFTAQYGGTTTDTGYIRLNSADASTFNPVDNVWPWNSTAPTSSTFSVGYSSNIGSDYQINQSSEKYIAFLFATLSGISKVGTYSGTGSNINVDCGFSAGARFVLIKRTDSTGDWYVWDTARGIVSGNDPYLLLNSTAAEVTSTDYIDPYSAGFQISSTAPAAINASGGSFIFLSIA